MIPETSTTVQERGYKNENKKHTDTNNNRGIIKSHIFGREVERGLRLMHFKEPM